MVHRACLDPEELDVLLRGDLEHAERADLEAHLAECTECREVLSTLAKLQTTPPEELGAPPPEPEPKDLHPRRGTQVGRYTILDCLGAGGMAVVYSAHDPELARKVAVKVLRPDVVPVGRHELQDRLRREAQAMAQMAHPNVLTVYDVGLWDGRVFIAMELVDGHNLSQWLVEAPRSWREIVAVFLRAGEGLVAAHAAGLIHRDFKPANVMVGDNGTVRVGDFGLARTVPAPDPEVMPALDELLRMSTQSVTGPRDGTPYFMAPEQFRGEPVSPRSDQFSFCVALHAAITGVHPFTGRRVELLLASGARRAPSVPRWLQPILRRGLSLAPEDRYPSMAALLAAIARGPARRRKVIAAVAIAIVALKLAAPTRADATSEQASDTEMFAATPDLRAVFDREWRAMHTDACELPHARCILQATNLLREPGAWQPVTKLSRVEDYLRLTGGEISQTVPWPVPPRRSYSARFRVRGAPGLPARGHVSLQSAGKGGETAAITSFIAGAEWSTVSVTLSSSAHYRQLRVAIALDAPGQLDIDDGELVDAGLMDASFERAQDSAHEGNVYRAAAWVPFNHSKEVYLVSRAADAFDGSRVLLVQSAALGGSVAQDTDQTPLAANTYTFTAWLRAGAGARSVDGSLALWALGSKPMSNVTPFTVGPDWTPVQVSLNVNSAGYAGLRAEIYIVSTDVPMEIDATSLLPAGLVDASFEDGTAHWTLSGAATTVQARNPPTLDTLRHFSSRDSDRARDGDAWLQVHAERDHDAIAQEVGVPASGSTYTFSAWVRAPEGSARVPGQLLLHSLGGTLESAATAFEATREWTLITTKLTIQRADHTGLRVELQLDGAGTRLDVDGTRLTGANPG